MFFVCFIPLLWASSSRHIDSWTHLDLPIDLAKSHIKGWRHRYGQVCLKFAWFEKEEYFHLHKKHFSTCSWGGRMVELSHLHFANTGLFHLGASYWCSVVQRLAHIFIPTFLFWGVRYFHNEIASTEQGPCQWLFQTKIILLAPSLNCSSSTDIAGSGKWNWDVTCKPKWVRNHSLVTFQAFHY